MSSLEYILAKVDSFDMNGAEILKQVYVGIKIGVFCNNPLLLLLTGDLQVHYLRQRRFIADKDILLIQLV